ncbi:hemicentin-1-like [Hydractinia symbiolongicarpus]|uniref:hemicentin-1-like n=1 Tax=Hydractinia symbiolongicarpus TaxID=13093 RepID=UPI00254F58BF|nr:hemicentin-1-like [Hydractinia symbiolongicarpus]
MLLIKFVVFFLLQRELVATPGFTSVPGRIIYVSAGDKAVMKWTFETDQTFLRARWGLFNKAENRIIVVYISKKEQKDVELYDNRIKYQNGAMIVEQASLSDSGWYRCELDYQEVAAPIVNDTQLIVTDLNEIASNATQFEVVENSTLTLHLNVTGSPKPVINWYFNGAPLREKHESSVIEHPSSIYQLILRINITSHANNFGYYQPRIEFPGATSKQLQKFEVKVRYMPSTANFTVNNTLKDNHTIKSGEQVIIKCVVSSYPASNYVIRKNGSLILNDTTGQHIIKYMTFHDEGWYTCFARNGIGEGITTRLYLTYGVLPRFLNSNRSSDIPSGENMKLVFNITSKPRPEITFQFNGKSLHREFERNDEESVMFYTATLIVKNALPEDHGIFTCHAVNEIGEAVSFFNLNVLYTLQFPANGKPKNLTGILTNNITIPCEAIINPGDVLYTWLFNNKTISSHINKNYGNLTLQSLKHTHQGFYTCVASSRNNVIEASSYLNIIVSPNITYISKDTILSTDNIGDFKCEASGSPPPQILWRRNDSNLVIHEGERLTFFPAETDLGKIYFECEATSIAGSQKKTILVAVIAPTKDSPTDDKAGWLIPLLIGISLLLLLILFAFFIRRKLKGQKKDTESVTKSEETEIFSDRSERRETTNQRDKLTLNPMFQDGENHIQAMYPVYLPREIESSNMQILSVQRFQGEPAPWPGSEGTRKEEMTVEMLFGDEEEKYDRQKSLLITKSFVNEGFKNEEIKSNGRVVEGEYKQELEEIDFEIENENDIDENVDQYVDDLFDFR